MLRLPACQLVGSAAEIAHSGKNDNVVAHRPPAICLCVRAGIGRGVYAARLLSDALFHALGRKVRGHAFGARLLTAVDIADTTKMQQRTLRTIRTNSLEFVLRALSVLSVRVRKCPPAAQLASVWESERSWRLAECPRLAATYPTDIQRPRWRFTIAGATRVQASL